MDNSSEQNGCIKFFIEDEERCQYNKSTGCHSIILDDGKLHETYPTKDESIVQKVFIDGVLLDPHVEYHVDYQCRYIRHYRDCLE